ncbi:MAG: VIT1/CCC1 transporter family protein [Sporolactobacillus sp.]
MNHEARLFLKLKRESVLFHFLCGKWSRDQTLAHNREIYARLSQIEKQIISLLVKDATGHQPEWRLKIYFFMGSLLGFTFVTQWLLKKRKSQLSRLDKSADALASGVMPRMRKLLDDEHQIIGELRERRLDFVGAIILGMNDALVELTGSVAGFTLSMSNTKLIAIAGLITGTAASLSMAASEFMAERSERQLKKAVTAALYTGVSYFATVILLVLPFLFLPAPQYLPALILTLVFAALIIFVFSYYMSVAKEISFKKRFFEMISVSFGVALFSFLIGLFVKLYLGLQI